MSLRAKGALPLGVEFAADPLTMPMATGTQPPMKRGYELERAEDLPADPDVMPDDKVKMALACAVIKTVVCDDCGEETWLIGRTGWNGQDSCHNCGTSYKVVG